MRKVSAVAALGVLLACSRGVESARVDASVVRGCLERSAQRWSEIPVSDFDAPVFAIDFGSNSVQIFVEEDEVAVKKEGEAIREAEVRVGNTGSSRVILNSRGNVLISWANEPADDQRDVVARCAGFS